MEVAQKKRNFWERARLLFSSPFRRQRLAAGRVSPSHHIGAASSFRRPPFPCCGGADAGRGPGRRAELQLYEEATTPSHLRDRFPPAHTHIHSLFKERGGRGAAGGAVAKNKRGESGGVEGGTPTFGDGAPRRPRCASPSRHPRGSVLVAAARRLRCWPRSRRTPVRRRITPRRRRPLFSSHLKARVRGMGGSGSGGLGEGPLN